MTLNNTFWILLRDFFASLTWSFSMPDWKSFCEAQPEPTSNIQKRKLKIIYQFTWAFRILEPNVWYKFCYPCTNESSSDELRWLELLENQSKISSLLNDTISCCNSSSDLDLAIEIRLILRGMRRYSENTTSRRSSKLLKITGFISGSKRTACKCRITLSIHCNFSA